MLFEFTEEVHACPKFDSGNAIVDACRTYIHAHVHDRINFYDLAKTCGFSLDWIQHMYHRHTGETLTDSVRKVKIEKAKYYLEYSELTGAEISERLSFCSQSYFIAQFRKETGMTLINFGGRTGLCIARGFRSLGFSSAPPRRREPRKIPLTFVISPKCLSKIE